jgi:hypothetical protein
MRRIPMKFTALAAVALLSIGVTNTATAQLPAASYEGDLGKRVVTEAKCKWATIEDLWTDTPGRPKRIVLPEFLGGGTKYMRAGQYVDPATCQVVGN